MRPDEDGILHVGVIPFLLDTSILDGIIKEAKSSQRRNKPIPEKRWLKLLWDNGMWTPVNQQ